MVGGASKDVTVLQTTGPVVGIFGWAQYTIKETCLQKGDLLLIFTDGVTDARNEANLEYGKEAVEENVQLR